MNLNMSQNLFFVFSNSKDKKEVFIMKKVLIALVLVVMVLASFTVSFAHEITPFYIATSNNTAYLQIDDDEAGISVSLTPKTSTSLDKVNIRIKLINNTTKETVLDGSWNTYYNSTLHRFSKEVTQILTTEGTYYAEITYKCYKNNVLIETIESTTSFVAYNK